MPTVKQLMAIARVQLAETETPSLDARLLLQHATGLTHAELVADPEHEASEVAAASFEAMVARRVQYEPVSRILGCREFYGRMFQVTSDVLDPRADTETIVETCLKYQPQRILDLGTGSGILAITLLAECVLATGVAVDLSPAALAVAKGNAQILNVADRLQFVEGSWFSNVEGRFDLIVSNPPYIPTREIDDLDVEVKNHDPMLALVGGQDGLDCYREIAASCASHLEANGKIALEIGAGQEDEVIGIFKSAGYDLLDRTVDLGGHVRCLVFQLAAQSLKNFALESVSHPL